MFRGRARRAGFTAVEILAVTGILTGLGGGAFVGNTSQAHQTACQQQLRQIGMAIQMMTMTGEPLPKAWFYPPDRHQNRETYNIVRLMSSHVPANLFVCPAAPQEINRRGIAYVYNSRVGGRTLDSIGNPSRTWLLMDINVVSDQVPPAHRGGCNVLFADGSVKWFPASQLPKFPLPQTQEG